MKKECLLGIDMGTSSVKVGLFDLKGNSIAFADESYPLYTPSSGWAEQKTEEWWIAICRATRRVVKESGIDRSCIIGMSVDTTCCTVICMDDKMEVLRPAILWMDVRASKQAKAITATKHDVLKFVGYGNVSAETMPAKVLWLKENEKETYDKAKYIVECTDWLLYRLTGELNASISACGPRWLYDKQNGGFRRDFYEQCGIGEAIEKFPETVLELGVKIGTLGQSAAGDLGLLPGIPIGEGGPDAFVGMLGLNVVAPGKIAMITGTSHLHLGLVEREMHSEGMWGSYPDAVIPGLQLIEGGQTSTGAIVNWFKNNFADKIGMEAQEQGKSVYTMLEEGAEGLPVGAEGLIALDFFQGNRTPYVDPDVRGMFYGLSLKHTPYHMYRAILESICYGTENILRSFQKGGTDVSGIYISGGAANSRLWMQIHADVSNVPLYVPKVTEAPCLGSAILGAVACGAYPDIQTASDQMVKIERTIIPDSTKHEQYRFYFEKYMEAYLISKDWMHDITLHL